MSGEMSCVSRDTEVMLGSLDPACIKQESETVVTDYRQTSDNDRLILPEPAQLQMMTNLNRDDNCSVIKDENATESSTDFQRVCSTEVGFHFKTDIKEEKCLTDAETIVKADADDWFPTVAPSNTDENAFGKEMLHIQLGLKNTPAVIQQDHTSQGHFPCTSSPYGLSRETQSDNTQSDNVPIKLLAQESTSFTAVPSVTMSADESVSDMSVEDKPKQVVFPVGLYKNVYATDCKSETPVNGQLGGESTSIDPAAGKLDTGECETLQQIPCADVNSDLRTNYPGNWQHSTSVEGHQGGETASMMSAADIKVEPGDCETLQQRTHTGEESVFMTYHSRSMQQPCAPSRVTCSSSQMPAVTTTVTDDGPFCCEQCGAAFKQYSRLKKHMIIHSEEKPFTCEQCGAAFRQSYHLKRHEQSHTGYKPYMCKQCGVAFLQSGDLKRHMQSHTGDKPYKCGQCAADFTRSSSLKAHMLIHTGDKPHKCKQCEASFTHSSSLRCHMRSHIGERPYKCDVCGEAFKQSSTLKSHMHSHSGDKPFKCEQCEASFSQSGSLKRHMLSHTGDRPFKCKQCSAAFIRSSHLKQHMVIHTGEKSYVCRHCGAAFNKFSLLKHHLQSHSVHKPCVCKQCGAAFAQPGHLNLHMRSHAGDRFTCKECGKSFRQPRSLRLHMLTHTGEKPFACKECGKSFTQSRYLKLHVITHTDEKPHVCKECGKAFNRSNNLKAHMQSHTGDRPYVCKQCGITFTWFTQLRRHMRTHATVLDVGQHLSDQSGGNGCE